MDREDIYNYFKGKLGHDIAEMLYDLTRNHLALTTDPSFICDKSIRCHSKSMVCVENYIKFITVEPETYIEIQMVFKLISGVDRRNGTMHLSKRNLLANEMKEGVMQLTNCSQTILSPGLWVVTVTGMMLSAGKVVINLDNCRLNVKSVRI